MNREVIGEININKGVKLGASTNPELFTLIVD